MTTSLSSLARRLETFLGGMETRHSHRPRMDLRQPLKPSLVEWKHCQGLAARRQPRDLETFLGGMETNGTPSREDWSPSLETFLGGMETHPGYPPWPCPLRALETFLGGMETAPVPAGPRAQPPP